MYREKGGGGGGGGGSSSRRRRRSLTVFTTLRMTLLSNILPSGGVLIELWGTYWSCCFLPQIL
jgi:hypothetical protein